MDIQNVKTIAEGPGTGPANNETAMVINSGANPFAAAAIQARNMVQGMYKTVGINAYKSDASQVRVVTMEARGLSASSENPYLLFTVSNTTENDVTVVFGSVLGIAGAYLRHNTSATACDTAGITDDYGASVKQIQGFSELANYSPVIVTQIQVNSSNQMQVGQLWKYGDLPYDDNIQSINIAVNPQFTRFDQNGTIVNIPGVWFIGPQTFLSTVIKAGTKVGEPGVITPNTALFTLYLSGSASGRNFRQMNG